jgi:hypothetical protein
VKLTRYWGHRDAALSSQHSPMMITEISGRYPDYDRKEWTYWPKQQVWYELTDLHTAATETSRAAHKLANILKVVHSFLS